ncbi:MAG: outer membrane lipoprotein-sorting protein [Nitrospirota bacterium]
MILDERGVPWNSPRACVTATVGLIVAVVLAVPLLGWAQDPGIDDIVRLVRAQDDAIDDETADVDIRSTDAQGESRSTSLRLYWKNQRGKDGLLGLTLLVTQTPLNRKGESFLLRQAERATDSQAWLYLPELRQALRITIAGQDIQRPKRNADMLLGFEQLGARLLGKAERAVAGRESLDGVEYVIVDERVDGEPDALRRFWVSPTNWTIAKIESRGAGGRIDLTQLIEWQQVGRAWVWKRVEIRGTDPPGHTVVELRNVTVNTGLSDRVFTVNTMKSGRVP